MNLWGIEDKPWWIELILMAVILVSLNFLFKKLIKQARYHSLTSSSGWREKVDYIFYRPFQVLMWVLGVTMGLEIIGHRFEFLFLGSYINALRVTGFVFCSGWVLLRWKQVLQRHLLTKQQAPIDPSFAQSAGKIISVVIALIAALVVLQVWGVNIAPLVAFGGIGAAAIGFAAKDVLANVFGGMMLHVNRRFILGDFVHLPDQKLEGYVEEIGWSMTTLRDKDRRPIYLPNALFSSASVINATRMTHRRIFEKVGVRYEDFDRLPRLLQSIRERLSAHPLIDSTLPVLIVLDGFGDSGLNLLVDVYTLQTRYDQFLLAKHEILALIYEEVREAGAELCWPVVSLMGSVTTRVVPASH